MVLLLTRNGENGIITKDVLLLILWKKMERIPGGENILRKTVG